MQRPLQPILLVALVAAATSASLLPSRTADACGGFFCSRANPVDQDGELILFASDGEEVEMHVQIKYSGPSERFAWILPVPANHPDELVSVGTEVLFQALMATTSARLQLQTRVEGECLPHPSRCYSGNDDMDGGAGPGEGEAEAEGEVEVLLEDQVGPYDVVVLAADNAEILLAWLRDNGYDIPAATEPLLRPYLSASHFVALRLTKGADTGDIQPIILKYRGTPMIPMRLTAVAASPDMPVFAWLLGEGRGVPLNFAHVVPNEARLPWQGLQFDGQRQRWDAWDNLVGAAADEAGGRAFATEFAGRASVVSGSFPDPERFNLAALRRTGDPGDFIQAMLRQGFPRDSKMQALIRRFIAMPEELVERGVSERDFYNCVRCYRGEWDRSGAEFDADAFVEALVEEVIEPLASLQELFDTLPDLTLLNTQLSPEEMDLDPTFGFNADLPDVARTRQATLVFECAPDIFQTDAPFRLELADGTVAHVGSPRQEGRGRFVPDASLPAAARVEQLAASGAPEVRTDNGPAIRDALAATVEALTAALPETIHRDAEEADCSAICCGEEDACGWRWNNRCDCGAEESWDWREHECGQRNCRPGQAISCVCNDGANGSQTCDREGLSYGACGCQSQPPERGRYCAPQRQIACACGGGITGTQTCESNGSGYGACDCGSGPPDVTEPEDPVGRRSLAYCVPGRVVPCDCVGGTSGSQECADDGLRFKLCSCAEPLPGDSPDGGAGRTEQVGCAGGCTEAGGSAGFPWWLPLATLLGAIPLARR